MDEFIVPARLMDEGNLKENDGNVITHWNILNTQYHTIEVNNDEELGNLFFLSKKHNINWYGYIYIVE